ncbi:unsaturated rhamnogalacturonyl hydrolase [Evansella caseinilytica]|uniref:Unsaturated rhamnogalacturonyl hydrolase n=1 Tax=Evansella caseinilytica TaxID=1503961 RepID=A0A1H3NY63_9BACI|nr:glycoside hydrolase family 105 protein [Evansella caseinilytica]SDY93822.1 unsaturated rhamnogalacturonyl hydrolase [Evansella caseinilytica]
MTNQRLFNEKKPLQWAEDMCRSLMNRYEPVKLPPADRWHYHQGVFLCGMHDVWVETDKEDYYLYFKEYVDKLVDEEGNFLFRRSELDAIQPGLLLFPLYKATGDKRYKIAAGKLRNLLKTLNRTKEGGFWHKDQYPYQMWLDGLYMAGPFTILYGQSFSEPELTELVLHQESLMRKHTKDEKTGLYFHGWDETGTTSWSLSETHTAPEIWGRSLGWYGIALVNIIEMLPEGHPNREELIGVLRELIANLVKYQDDKTGLWYQIVDKGDRSDNWLESSCSALFVFTIAKAVNLGYVDKNYYAAAEKGYDGIVNNYIKVTPDGSLALTGICIGTSIGVYEYYVNRDTVENDLHGVGAFILASVQMHQYSAG